MRNHRTGFTLAELLIVMVILGILGGIALPRFYPQQEKARSAEAVTMLSAARQGELAYHLETGNYTANWTNIGLEAPTSSYFGYSLNSSTGEAQANRTSAAGGNTTHYIVLYVNGTWSGVGPNVPVN